MRYSQELVHRYQHRQWDVEHIVLAILELGNGLTEAVFSELNISIRAVSNRLSVFLEVAPKVLEEVSQLYTPPRVQRLLEDSKVEAERLRDEFIGVERLFLAANDTLKKTFHPECLNRIDETVIFNPLSPDQVGKIVQIMVSSLIKCLIGLGITLELTADAEKWLATAGLDPVYGARPLTRCVQKSLEDPISRNILLGDFNDGDVLVVDVSGDDLSISKRERVTQVLGVN